MKDVNRKVCVIGPSDYYCSGVSIHTIILTNALAKSGKNKIMAALVRKLTPQFLYPGRGHIGNEQCPQPLEPSIKSYSEIDWYSISSWIIAYRFIRNQKPDVIIMQWWTSATLHILLLLAIMNRFFIRAKLIIELHEVREPLEMGILPIRLYARLASSLLMHCADAFTTHTNKVKQEAIEQYSLSEETVFPIPFALYDMHGPLVDKIEAKNELGLDEAFIILYFGQIRKYKGLPFLIHAFGQLPKEIAESSRLLIAGEDWKEDCSIDQLLLSASYKEQITFDNRYIPNEMIPKYFSIADIVVFPYTETSGSGAVSLAMVYGKPILVSDLVNMRELVQGYDGACFFDPRDIASISNCIKEMYREKQKLGELPSYSPPQTGWDEVVRRYDLIMDWLTG